MRCHAYRLRLNFWLEATTMTRTKEDQTSRVVGKKCRWVGGGGGGRS